MAWFRLDDTWGMHPKIQAAGLKGRALWIAGGLHCAQQLTDGIIAKTVVAVLAAQAGVTAKEARTLVDVGLWHDEGDHYRMHDYHDYQPSREEFEARQDKKRSAAAKGNHERWHVARGVTDPACPLCDSQSDRKPIAGAITNGSHYGIPPSRPVPSPEVLTKDHHQLSVVATNDPLVTDTIRIIADHQFDRAMDTQLVDDEGAYRAGILKRVRAELAAPIAATATEHPDWTAAQLAAKHGGPLASLDDIIGGAA